MGSPGAAAVAATGGEKRLALGRFSFATVASEFSGRANCIGFFRWFFAFVVIFDHVGPLAGYFDSKHFLGIEPSTEQSIGGVAVAGFFFFSGFLITRSRKSLPIGRFFWHRVVRIFPAFWLALIMVAFVIAPISWIKERGSISGYFSAGQDSPLTYFFQNMFLMLDQRNIAGMGEALPFAKLGGYDWNGSAWTLQYEFKAYLLVGVIGIIGWAAGRYVMTALALGLIVLNGLYWSGHVQPATWFGGHLADLGGHAFLVDPYNLMLLAPFAFGMLLACWSEKIPMNGWLAAAGLALGIYTFTQGNWNAFGQFGIMYCFMFASVRFKPLFPWEQKFGDLSYGTYILAWPLMQMMVYFGLTDLPPALFLAINIAGVTVYALFSWHVIEKPALTLKDWTPSFLVRKESGTPPSPPPAVVPPVVPPVVAEPAPAMAMTSES